MDAPKVKYAKDEIGKRIARALMLISAPRIIGEERVESPEHCEICGSPKMCKVVLVQDGTGKVHRCSAKCARLLTGGMDS